LTDWLNAERRKVDDAIYQVRRHLAVPPPGARDQWVIDAREAFRRMTEHLKKHMALKEAGGYLHEVRTRHPHLASEVDRLQHEHDELGRLMDQVQTALDELRAEDNLLIRSCCVRISTLLAYIEQHEEQEQRLLLHMFGSDSAA
jgi:hemerythrin-like domain-containing protein